MASVNSTSHLLDTLKRDAEIVGGEAAEQIFLTPYLALACALLYMMASDGELEAEESSQLQAVLGGDQSVLNYALRYVQSVPVEQFFASSREILSVKDKWCILTNVCDALLSDGRADRSELALFGQMAAAFGGLFLGVLLAFIRRAMRKAAESDQGSSQMALLQKAWSFKR